MNADRDGTLNKRGGSCTRGLIAGWVSVVAMRPSVRCSDFGQAAVLAARGRGRIVEPHWSIVASSASRRIAAWAVRFRPSRYFGNLRPLDAEASHQTLLAE